MQTYKWANILSNSTLIKIYLSFGHDVQKSLDVDEFPVAALIKCSIHFLVSEAQIVDLAVV